MKANVNGVNLSYEAQGEGVPLVLIMGLGSDRRAWRFQLPALKKHFRVVTYDARGIGESDRPPGPYTTRQMADDAVGLMDLLSIQKAHVLGVSMGGMVAQELAINYPERVSKLVLGCTCACTDAANGETPAWAAALKDLADSKRALPMNLLFSTWIWRAIGFVVVRRQFARTIDSNRAGFVAQRQACAAHNTLDRLGSITAPTLVIGGAADRVLWPSSSDTLARLIPGATLVKIPGGSHMFMAEGKGRFNREVLAFLGAA